MRIGVSHEFLVKYASSSVGRSDKLNTKLQQYVEDSKKIGFSNKVSSVFQRIKILFHHYDELEQFDKKICIMSSNMELRPIGLNTLNKKIEFIEVA
ncbi:hypothetical protein N9Y92_04160, partial [Chlamydiales bacterium]|nr:hypothetical protein [Chlamydiales bacterium]